MPHRLAPADVSQYRPPRARAVSVCSDEKPRCPYGHRLKPAHRPSLDGTLTCDHQAPGSGQRCNALCYVVLVCAGGSATVRGTGERIWLVIEVTPAEVRHFAKTPMLVVEKLAYLGVAAPGVSADLFGASDA